MTPVPPRSSRRAFTLLELIIAIGIILLLASLLLIALGGVRGVANRFDSTNALRQMMAGYSSYAADAQQRLLPGFIDDPSALGIRVRLASGETLADPRDGSSYVWRLAPYVDDDWAIFLRDYRSDEVNGRIASELSGSVDDDGDGTSDFPPVYGEGTAMQDPSLLGLGRVPSFGLNSIYVGGDTRHGGTAIVAQSPFADPPTLTPIAATRLSEATNPARLIVFAPVRHFDGSLIAEPPVSDVQFGYPELRPPVIVDRAGVEHPQWEIVAGQIDTSAGDFDEGGGVPLARWSKANEIPLGHLDGSVTTRVIDQLAFDKQAWSPFFLPGP
jgi:prepilin-type N-terminal cleavage/methylation domain-containing protein